MIDQARRFAGFLFILVLLLAARAGNVCAEKIIYYEPGDVFPIQGEAEQLEVHFINVGAADCFLIRSGEHTMLVDSGIRSHSGAIIHYLESLDIRELSYMFATHPHDDHIGGFTGILTQVPVCEFIWPELFDLCNNKEYVRLNRRIDEKGIPTRTVSNGDTIHMGGALLEFIQWQDAVNLVYNYRSMALQVSFGERTLLLTADIAGDTQKALIEEYGHKLQADILKIPHHSITMATPALLNTVQASLGIITNQRISVKHLLNYYDRHALPCIFTTEGTIVSATDGVQWHVLQLPKHPPF